MADPAEPQPPQTENLGPCAWCGEPGLTRLFVEGKKSAKHRKTAVVCGDHERHFILQGATSERSEFQEQYQKGRR